MGVLTESVAWPEPAFSADYPCSHISGNLRPGYIPRAGFR